MGVLEKSKPLRVWWDRYRGERDKDRNVFLLYPRNGVEWLHLMPWKLFQTPEDMHDHLSQSFEPPMGGLIAGGILLRTEVNFTILEVPESQVPDIIRRWHQCVSEDPRDYPFSQFFDAYVRICSERTPWGTIRQVIQGTAA